jgi:hypothetical protein
LPDENSPDYPPLVIAEIELITKAPFHIVAKEMVDAKKERR